MLNENGLSTDPKIVAELGPGDSLGLGLCALISGAEKYYALDIVEFAEPKRNIEIFEKLVHFFSVQESIPDECEFPRVQPLLFSYKFPNHILTDERLKSGLDKARLTQIRNSILDPNSKESIIQYKVPWNNSRIIEKTTIDLVISQAVLEHIEDLESTYKQLNSWLKTNGIMSHLIDYKCHGSSNDWNGHWKYSRNMWKLIKGRRPYFINREPHSTHLIFLKQNGFSIVCDKRVILPSKISSKDLSNRFKNIENDDLNISSSLIQSIKI